MVKKKSLAWPNCSEVDLKQKIQAWLNTTDLTNTLVFLEGEMGAGKSTFVREILRVLSPSTLSQGSPTFPIVQTYQTSDEVSFYHIDLYRLKDEAELTDAGIEDQIEEEGSIACIEWASLFPNSFAHWFRPSATRSKAVFLVRIETSAQGLRNYWIESYSDVD